MKLNSALRAWAILMLAQGPLLCGAAPAARTTPDGLAVFRAVLRFGCRTAHQGYYVVSDVPDSVKDEPPPSGWPSRSLWMKLAAPAPSSLRWPHLNICADRVVDGKEVDWIFVRQTAIPPRWEPFYAKFRGAKGLIRISPPAFTSDGRHAVVYLEEACDQMCASGAYLEYRRENGGWKLWRWKFAWVT